MSLSPDQAFDRDIPEHLRGDVMQMIAEAAQGWASHAAVTILESDRYDAINVRAHGIVEVEGEEYTFIVEDGNWNGTVLEDWNGDKEFEGFHRTEWALAPRPDIVSKHIAQGRGLFLIAKWDALLSQKDVASIVGSYTYDRMMQPGGKIEDYYREKAAKYGFVLTVKEDADRTRASLAKVGDDQ